MKPIHNILLFLTNYLVMFLVFISLPILLVVRIVVRKKGVLYLENFPEENAGYQYRSKKWAELLSGLGIKVSVKTVISDRERFDNAGHFYFLCLSYFKKAAHIASSLTYETVIVRRELLAANDYGNLFMERFLLAIHSHVILDFDDDIADAKNQPKSKLSLYAKLMLEHPDKFNATLKLYRKFIVGSPFLAKLITAANPQLNQEAICYIPTCVNYDEIEPKKDFFENNHIVFGWIGGINNLYLLESIIPSLIRISENHNIKLIVIAGTEPKWETPFELQFFKWSLSHETELLKKIDVGLMPLHDNIESLGKCGFKLIQYMGLGIPGIASGIGINSLIIENGINGFLVEPGNTWDEVIEKVIRTKETLPSVGNRARKTIHDAYTFNANKNKYIQFVLSK